MSRSNNNKAPVKQTKLACPGNRVQPTNKPKTQAISKKNDYVDEEEDYFEEGVYDDFGASIEGDDLNSDFQQKTELSQNGGSENVMTEEEKRAEAPIKWDSAEIYFDHVFDLSELVRNAHKGGITLSKEGKLEMSVANGLLGLEYRSHNPDFLQATKEEKSFSAKDTKKKNALSSQNSTMLGDIVKSVKLVGFKMTGYDGTVRIHLKSIPKFQEEGHGQETEHVNALIMPHMWQTNTSHSIEIFNRTITNSMMHFQKRFPGMTPENLMAEVQRAKGDRFLVPLSNPIVALINRDKAAVTDEEGIVLNGEYKNPSLVATGQVLIPKHLVKQYKPETLDAMKKGMSYANISDQRFEVAFELPCPSHLTTLHEEFEKTEGKDGRQFLGWADTPYKANPMALASALPVIKSKDQLFKEPGSQALRLQGKFIVYYKRQTNEVAEDL